MTSPAETSADVSVAAAIGKANDITYQIAVQVLMKGDKLENRILALGSYRLYILASVKDHLKTETSFHFLEINTLIGKTSSINYEPQLNFNYGNKSLEVHFKDLSKVEEVVQHILISLQATFPDIDASKLIKIQLEEEESHKNVLSNVVQAKTYRDKPEPCGGYSRMFLCMSSYYNTAYREEVSWDIDTIYMSQNNKILNLHDFDHLDPKTFAPIIAALCHNVWFTKLYASKVKLSNDALEAITRVVKNTTTLTELNLACMHSTSMIQTAVSFSLKDFGSQLGQAIASNQLLALTTLDLSRNHLEDKGIISIANALAVVKFNLEYLNLSNTGMTSKGASAVGSAVKSNQQIRNSLKTLIMSRNSLKGDMSWCDFLSNHNVISHLDLSNSDCQVSMLFTALLVGCVNEVVDLNLSGNHFVSKKVKDFVIPSTIQDFFTNATSLKNINLANNKMPPEALTFVLNGLAANDKLKDIELNLSGNDMKSTGAKILAEKIGSLSSVLELDISDNGLEAETVEVLNSLTSLKHLTKLTIGQNCSRSNKNLHKVLEELGKFVNRDDSELTYLSLAGSKLKYDIAVFLDALGMNKTLLTLNITGNNMGNKGAKMLAKVLLLNTTLQTIYWDKNGTSSHGFRDIAVALRHNHTVKLMPVPIYDTSGALKGSTDRHVKEIQDFLIRNNAENTAYVEATYRLEESIMSYAIFDSLDDAIFSLEETTVKAKNVGIKCDAAEIDKLIQAARNVKQVSSQLKEDFENSVHTTINDRLQDGIVKATADSKDTLKIILKDASEQLAKNAIEQFGQDFDIKDEQDKLTSICREKSSIEQFEIQEEVLNHVMQHSKKVISKRSLEIVASMLEIIIGDIVAILDNRKGVIEEEIKEKIAQDKKAQELAESGNLLSVPGMAVFRTRTLSASNRSERKKRPTSMADLSAAEGGGDDIEGKVQAQEQEHQEEEAAPIKVEVQEDSKASSEKKRGFRIKTPNFSPIKGIFKRSGDTKVVKQKSLEEEKAAETLQKAPEKEKSDEEGEDLAVQQQNGQQLDHITKDRPHGPQRRPPTRPTNSPDATENDKAELEIVDDGNAWTEEGIYLNASDVGVEVVVENNQQKDIVVEDSTEQNDGNATYEESAH